MENISFCPHFALFCECKQCEYIVIGFEHWIMGDKRQVVLLIIFFFYWYLE